MRNLLLLSILLFTAQSDAFQIRNSDGILMQFGGVVEMEFVDVEGSGGFAHRDLTFQKVKTRSPHARIDKAVLSTKIIYNENLYYKAQLRFDDNKARVDKHYAHLNAPLIRTLFEIGKNRPYIHTGRRTEGYPLIGTAYWRGREYHITSQTEFPIAEDISLVGALSTAQKRPLGTGDAAEDKSFKLIVYDDSATKDGQTFEYGAILGLKALDLSILSWYYNGKLIDDFDWKTQLSQSLAEYDKLGDRTDRTHWWYGGRISFDRHKVHAQAEFINSQDGLLPRDGYYIEGSYRIELLPLKDIEPLARLIHKLRLKNEFDLRIKGNWIFERCKATASGKASLEY